MAKKKSKRKPAWQTQRFLGQTFCFCGELQHTSQPVVKEFLEFEGARVVRKVTADLTYLVVGKRRGGKDPPAQARAEEFNRNGAAIGILEELDFHQLAAPTADLIASMLCGGKAGEIHWSGLTWIKSQYLIQEADFRNMEFGALYLHQVDFENCDFTGSTFDEAYFGKLIRCTFDGCTFYVTRYGKFDHCSFREAEFANPQADAEDDRFIASMLGGAAVQEYLKMGENKPRRDISSLSRTTNCDFTEASLRFFDFRIRQSNDQNTFEGANLSGADFSVSKYEGLSFRSANLERANLARSKFLRSDFTSANLQGANLNDSDFSHGNFTKADLRGADLTDANFTAATVKGARFSGAKLAGAVFDQVDTSKVAGLASLNKTASGGAASKIAELQRIADQSKEVVVEIEARITADKYVQLIVQTWQAGGGSQARSAQIERGGAYRSNPGSGSSLTTCMQWLAQQWCKATPKVETVTVRSKKCPLPNKELKHLAIGAWCEAFGLPIPTKQDLNQQTKTTRAAAAQLREQAVAKLLTGKAGVEWFNELSREEKIALGSFRRVDFTACKLNAVSFGKLNLQHAVFSDAHLNNAVFANADLRKASFERVKAREIVLAGAKASDASFAGADLRDAVARFTNFLRVDFREAKLSRAELHDCNFGDANFVEANLAGADLRNTNLRGADFTGANLTRAKFDNARFNEITYFPSGFQLKKSMKWVGKGADPR